MFLGVATGAAVCAGTGFAATGVARLPVSPVRIHVTANRRPVAMTAQPVLYHYNVYVPVSTVAHALGATVRWVNSPPVVDVSTPRPAAPVKVFFNGRPLPAGLTDGRNYTDVPAFSPAYEQATGITGTAAANGNVNFVPPAPASLPAGAQSLLALKPTGLQGDFANASLYPGGRLTGYFPATVAGNLYPGSTAIQWGVLPGQTAKIPGLVYNLNGQYQTLSGSFAIDDLSKNFNGYVRLVFVGDGNLLGSTGWIQGGANPTPLSVNVSGVHSLTIEYELKSANGQIYTDGQTYAAPAANPDGLRNDPIVETDLIAPYLTP